MNIFDAKRSAKHEKMLIGIGIKDDRTYHDVYRPLGHDGGHGV